MEFGAGEAQDTVNRLGRKSFIIEDLTNDGRTDRSDTHTAGECRVDEAIEVHVGLLGLRGRLVDGAEGPAAENYFLTLSASPHGFFYLH